MKVTRNHLHVKFQSTRPAGDATYAPDILEHLVWISIHASRGGRDGFLRAWPWTRFGFQSTRPVGDATAVSTMTMVAPVFQSTRPVGDATRLGCRCCIDRGISIHASRGGRDGLGAVAFCQRILFQSTRPVGDATATMRKIYTHVAKFQSTRPVGDATTKHPPSENVACISIHASRGGRDYTTIHTTLLIQAFQSTRPVGDATTPRSIPRCLYKHFNPRVPWGTRRKRYITMCSARRFQSTRPVGDATSMRCWQNRAGGIFQSTRPVGDATLSPRVERPEPVISIHASRGGRDCFQSICGNRSIHFNPRVPWGTRRPPDWIIPSGFHFNPRVPWGTRRK